MGALGQLSASYVHTSRTILLFLTSSLGLWAVATATPPTGGEDPCTAYDFFTYSNATRLTGKEYAYTYNETLPNCEMACYKSCKCSQFGWAGSSRLPYVRGTCRLYQKPGVGKLIGSSGYVIGSRWSPKTSVVAATGLPHVFSLCCQVRCPMFSTPVCLRVPSCTCQGPYGIRTVKTLAGCLKNSSLCPQVAKRVLLEHDPPSSTSKLDSNRDSRSGPPTALAGHFSSAVSGDLTTFLTTKEARLLESAVAMSLKVLEGHEDAGQVDALCRIVGPQAAITTGGVKNLLTVKRSFQELMSRTPEGRRLVHLLKESCEQHSQTQ